MALFGREYAKLSDERLMELVVRGDEQAFAGLYDRYNRRLLNYFHRMLWQDREQAQDFLQDLFTKLAQRPQSYDPSRPFQTWLFSVANNMCKNAYRHEEVVRTAAIHLRNGVDREEAKDGVGVDHERFRNRLDDELDKLEPAHKATFIMRFHEDMAIKEIAAAFSCSEGTVKSRLFYTLKKLAERLKEFDPKPLAHMERRERYDPEDIESLLNERGFDELLEEERAYVLRHLSDREEYETMRGLLLHVRNDGRDRKPLEADDRVRTNVLAAFREQQRPQWRIWLNSLGALLSPREVSAMWRPALALGTLALLIVVGGVLVWRSGGNDQSELAEAKEMPAKAAEETKMPETVSAETAKTGDKSVQLSREDVPEDASTEAKALKVAEPVSTGLQDRNEDLPAAKGGSAGRAQAEVLDIQQDISRNPEARNERVAAQSEKEELEKARSESGETLADDRTTAKDIEDKKTERDVVNLDETARRANSVTGHVVTQEELMSNVSLANVSSDSKYKAVRAAGSAAAALQSRNLAADAGLLALLNAGW